MSFYNLKEKHFTRTEVAQAFIYQPEKGHRWLQKLCFWFLHKLNCQYIHSSDWSYLEPIEENEPIEKIIDRQIQQLQKMGKTPCYLVMGLRNFNRFQYHQPARSYISDINTETISVDPMEYQGLQISVHPHFDGIIVLPEINSRKCLHE